MMYRCLDVSFIIFWLNHNERNDSSSFIHRPIYVQRLSAQKNGLISFTRIGKDLHSATLNKWTLVHRMLFFTLIEKFQKLKYFQTCSKD